MKPAFYRPEVDGLRALAILPVILFHAHVPGFAGGFIGVDVFFVISGYLITSIMVRELSAGTFSLWRFYERRARRILPALLLVMAVTTVFAWLWMVPGEFETFARTLTAASLMVSNIQLWQETGYFAGAAELNPLLHTWSLAVEEQFYVFFPPLLWAIWRWRWRLAVMIGLCVLGLGLAEWGARHYPSAAFYLLPFRAWELGVGVCLALAPARLPDGAAPGWRAGAGALLGLGLIAGSVALLDRGIPFPGLAALAPVLGSALIIRYAGAGTLAGRWLAWGPLVGIGLISYPAYLWHQPLLAFARIRTLDEPGVALTAVLICASFGLAWLTWRLVETPVRVRAPRWWAVSGFAAGTLALIAVGVAGLLTNGLPARHGDPVFAEALEHRLRPNYGLDPVCEGSLAPQTACRTRDNPEVLLWGDSFAMQMADALIAAEPGIGLVQRTKNFCGPLLDLAPTDRAVLNLGWSGDCLAFNAAVRDEIAASPLIRTVVLASSFSQYLNPERMVYLAGEGGPELVPADLALAARRLAATVAWLEAGGRRVVVIAPPPADGRNIGRCLARRLWIGLDPGVCDIAQDAYRAHYARVLALLAHLPEGMVVYPEQALCSAGRCAATAPGLLVYRDAVHLSHEGAAWLGPALDLGRWLRPDE